MGAGSGPVNQLRTLSSQKKKLFCIREESSSGGNCDGVVLRSTRREILFSANTDGEEDGG